uniref:Ferritin n=1 Tax=Suricata suricatta TaxID=37032 RepID=A0A673UTM7_SURSU
MATALSSPVRQNYHIVCEFALNTQINLQFHASYMYLSMSLYFERADVALKNFSKFFLRWSHEATDHAEKLIKLQKQRGGCLRIYNIEKPYRDDWASGLKAMECAFYLEKVLNRNVLELHQLATEKQDTHLCSFLKTNYLREKVKTIKQLSDYMTNLSKMGAPDSYLAEYLFDKLTLGNSD